MAVDTPAIQWIAGWVSTNWQDDDEHPVDLESGSVLFDTLDKTRADDQPL